MNTMSLLDSAAVVVVTTVSKNVITMLAVSISPPVPLAVTVIVLVVPSTKKSLTFLKQ